MNEHSTTRLTAKYHHLPVVHLTEDFYRKYDAKPPSKEIIASLVRVSSLLPEESAVLMGGLCAHPDLLGARKMRKASNDLDYVVRAGKLGSIVETFSHLSPCYIPEHDEIFVDYEHLPVGFSAGKTHDWNIPDDFFSSARTVYIGDQPLEVIAPEYLIALKLRRWLALDRVYGKDKIDIASLLLEGDPPKVERTNLRRTSELIVEHTISDHSQLEYLMSNLRIPSGALSTREVPEFEKRIRELEENINEVIIGAYETSSEAELAELA